MKFELKSEQDTKNTPHKSTIMATIVEVPAAKQPKSAFSLEPSYEKQWNSVIQSQTLQQKTPHRYQQSPVFSRKAATSCPAESPEHHHHHHHHHHRRHHHGHRRRRGVSEGDKANLAPEERVHLLSELPWRKSGDFSSSSSDESLEVPVTISMAVIPKLNIPAMSPTLPRRYDQGPNFERERTWSMPTRRKPHMTRRKQRARSQDSSPASRKQFLELPLQGFQFSGSLVLGVQQIADQHSNVPQTPETPLADSDGFLKVPSFDGQKSPHTLRRFLGLETDINQNYKGLTEDEIMQSRLMSRRGSSSSDSSTSTLT